MEDAWKLGKFATELLNLLVREQILLILFG